MVPTGIFVDVGEAISSSGRETQRSGGIVGEAGPANNYASIGDADCLVHGSLPNVSTTGALREAVRLIARDGFAAKDAKREARSFEVAEGHDSRLTRMNFGVKGVIGNGMSQMSRWGGRINFFSEPGGSKHSRNEASRRKRRVER